MTRKNATNKKEDQAEENSKGTDRRKGSPSRE